MDKPIGYWIKKLDAALEAQLDYTLARIKLSRAQWQALNALGEAPLRPEELDAVLRPYWTDAAHQRERDLAALVGRGLLSMMDERLVLTERGRETYHQAMRLVEATRQDLSLGIGIDEYAMAVSVLQRMSINAERLSR
ncbi:MULTISPECIES: MarR family transcriptional regulator [unclassified Paenarthrobacter]|uniref:MarR family transcriptional regulator n=1 Tax=unclassified Paenarthrobacter TaxID=2634190 RepID=UPI003CF4F2B4